MASDRNRHSVQALTITILKQNWPIIREFIEKNGEKRPSILLDERERLLVIEFPEPNASEMGIR